MTTLDLEGSPGDPAHRVGLPDPALDRIGWRIWRFWDGHLRPLHHPGPAVLWSTVDAECEYRRSHTVLDDYQQCLCGLRYIPDFAVFAEFLAAAYRNGGNEIVVALGEGVGRVDFDQCTTWSPPGRKHLRYQLTPEWRRTTQFQIHALAAPNERARLALSRNYVVPVRGPLRGPQGHPGHAVRGRRLRREVAVVSDQLHDLLLALAGAPALVGARCRGRSHLFDEAQPDEDPDTTTFRHQHALTLCRGCTALASCQRWFDTLPARQRPPGVVAGRAPETVGRKRKGNRE